jgi:hypothetical protein
MTNYVEFTEKVQTEILNGLKAAQELNLKSFAAFNQLLTQIPTAKIDATSTEMPSATNVVEGAFKFTNELLETRKEYAVKLAELATEAQKSFSETAKRVAETAKN